MADELRTEAPPVGEEVHLPEPTILPLLVAVAVTVALVGITCMPLLTLAGAIATVWLVVRWIRETRREIGELPLDH